MGKKKEESKPSDKGSSSKSAKGKGKGDGEETKLKSANSINVRHILVRLWCHNVDDAQVQSAAHLTRL
jgi:hypothetical protein